MSARIKASGMLAVMAGAVAASLTLPAAAGEVDPHAAHQHAAAGEGAAQQEGLPVVARSVVNYVLPAVTLVRRPWPPR